MEDNKVRLPVILALKELKENSPYYSKLICWYTNSKFYHVEVILKDIWISSQEGEGVHVAPLKPLNNKWCYVDLGEAVLSKREYVDVMNWINEQVDKKYDWTGIVFSQFLPASIHHSNKWFCSEISCRLLQLLKYEQVQGIQPETLSPGDLAKLFKVE